MATPLFILQSRKFKSNGVIVSNYTPHPDVNIYIDAINVDNGVVAEKRIIGYSIHENLSMYRVESLYDEFETFWVSDDHSLIVYDSIRTMLRRISPVKVLEDIARYSLVKKGTEFHFDILPIKDNVRIEYDPNVTVGADFTVEDYYTFATSDGIFVQDTMACYVPLTKEAQQEALEKLMPVKASSGFNKQIFKLTNDVIAGIYIATE